MTYVPLWNKSNFSFLEGASHPHELVEAALAHQLDAIAITDRDSVGGVVRAYTQGKELGVRVIVGAQVTLVDDSLITLLAMTRPGYAQLCRLLTVGRQRREKGQSAVTWAEVGQHAEGLLALWGGARSLVGTRAGEAEVAGLKAAFGDRLYVMLPRHKLAEEVDHEASAVAFAERHGLPLVATTEVLYHEASRRQTQDILTCIQHGVALVAAGRLLRANSQHDLKAPEAFEALFADRPDAVARTREIAARCTFEMSELRYVYPSEALPDGRTSAEHLRQLAYEGVVRRFGEAPPAVVAQLETELALVDELDYCGYFLTMHEIVCFCRSRGILCQGRGSAANSVLCFVLGVTAVDPTQIELLFERFLSRERAEPPDIDLDIMHARREEVIQHVYERYGRTHAAMVANVIRYRSKSALRDVGKALGLPETGLDRLSKSISHWDEVSEQSVAESGLDPTVMGYQHLLELARGILDFPRHLSIHPGGFLLGHEPVHDLVPIENATMEGRTVIQWDKYDVEALGLFKVDLLGLGALTLLDQAFSLLRAHKGVDLDMARIPADDTPTYDMLCAGDTVGTFQVESRAQMSMLPRLRPREFYDLVVQISIVRPGPISGGMVHPYLRRRAGEEAIEYPHPCLEPVLEKTFGVPLFQEQVMKLAMVAADYTPGEADQLRRDMGAWKSSGRLERHRERLVERMMSKGIEEAFAVRVFEQIRGFGEYGFPESHAASFALIAYATCWLRCHHPEVFFCALLNAQPMGFYSVSTLLGDAKRKGVMVLPVDARVSAWDNTLEPVGAGTLAVRMGLRHVKGLHQADGERVVQSDRAWTSLSDFVRDTGVGDRGVHQLAEAGALRVFGLGRRETLWAVEGLVREAQAPLPLFTVDAQTPDFDDLRADERIEWDYATMAHSVEGHPLSPVRDQLRAQGLPTATQVNGVRNGGWARYAGVVICRQRPGTAAGVTFMTLEDETGFVNLVVWVRVWEKYAALLKRFSFIGVAGKVQNENGAVHLMAEHFWVPEVRVVEKPSRDFR